MEEKQKEVSGTLDMQNILPKHKKMKGVDLLLLIGRIFLSLVVAGYIYWLYVLINTEVNNYQTSLRLGFPYSMQFIPQIIIVIISIVTIAAAFFLIQKYPIATGIFLCSLGAISILLVYPFPPFTEDLGGNVLFNSIMFCCPMYLLVIVLGGVFLFYGLRRNK